MTTLSSFSGGTARAEGISGYVEYTYGRLRSYTEDPVGGVSTKTATDSFTQRYSLNLDRRLYPNLSVSTGGLFERDLAKLETATQDIGTATNRIRPFLNLRLKSPLYQAEGGYDRNEQKVASTGAPPVTDVQENYFGTLGWYPDGFPRTMFRYFRTETYDKARRFRDATDDRYQLVSEYRPAQPLFLKYTGTYEDQRNRLERNETQTYTHEGRVNYGDRFFRNRMDFSSDYTVVYQLVDITASGAGEIGFPVSPLAALSGVTDTPADVTLAPAPRLIDGLFTPIDQINIGIPASPFDTSTRNMGLDFGIDTTVNALLVWVNRDLPSGIAAAYSWEIYTSTDNRTWTLRQTVPAAAFGPFQQRFEIRFNDVTARYVKAVTRPLPRTVPVPPDFPDPSDIRVTELQALLRRPAADVAGKTSATSHRYTLGTRVKLLEAYPVYYELSYFLAKSGTSPVRYDLSNGVSAASNFGRIFSASARVAREDGRQPQGRRVAYVYTASLAATPLDTLRSSLVFSGRNERIEDATNDTYSALLFNTAQLYQGVDVNLGVGKSYQKAESGRKTDGTQISAGLTLVPHTTTTINVSYSGVTSRISGGDQPGETTDTTRTGDISVTVNPLPSVYLFGAYHIERKTGQPNVDSFNYALNWSPFPDGTLHFNFNYNETIRTEDNERTRTITPSARWNIARGSYLDLTYQDLKADSLAGNTRNEVASANLRIAF